MGQESISPRPNIVIPPYANKAQDCGVLAAYMVAHSLTGQGEFEPLEVLRTSLRKEPNEGTMPGNIVRLMVKSGFSTKYFTRMDWQLVASFTDEEAGAFAHAINNLGDKDSGMINKNALVDSAQWLTTKGSDTLHAWEHDPIQILKEEIADPTAFAILIIEANHYIVVVEQDAEEYFVVYDSNMPQITLRVSAEQLLAVWDVSLPLQLGQTIPGRPDYTLHMQEAIIVKKE